MPLASTLITTNAPMASQRGKSNTTAAYGDFQTPFGLAQQAVQLLHTLGVRPDFILEPTCGQGSFVTASAAIFPDAKEIIGIDINAGHLQTAATRKAAGIKLIQADFFGFDFNALFERRVGSWLILGNPPWVTNAALGLLNSANLPTKSNTACRRGIEAITGKSNFDISEWMLLRYLDWLTNRCGTIAVLCKTSVARKILLYIWTKRIPVQSARMYDIDALRHFGAAVKACFFVVQTGAPQAASCEVFNTFSATQPRREIGFADGRLIADMPAFAAQRNLLESHNSTLWRSGIKHDCANIMELTATEGGYVNGLGERVRLESTFLFPLLKGSDIATGRDLPRRMMLVPQRVVGEDTTPIRDLAPFTWRYLQDHAGRFLRRGSRIYRNKPSFSIFGVGPYSFAPWKIAIAGFSKRLIFRLCGPVRGKPVVFDDTVNFLPCRSENEGRFLLTLLESRPATEFYHAMIHWDEKRPVTIDILRRLSLAKLAAGNRGRPTSLARAELAARHW